MLFRQLFDPLSKTYTYLLGCEKTHKAVLIDPVRPQAERDIQLLESLGLRLVATLDTHIHADHITAATVLKDRLGSKIGMPASERVPGTEIFIQEGKPLSFGSLRIEPLHTPGHTESHFAFKVGDRVFTGDAVLINGCGRTDFQGGNARTLYESVKNKIFSLPEETLIYPGHDYQGRQVSCVGQERAINPRLNDTVDVESFERVMHGLNLPYPFLMDFAVPYNRQGGICPAEAPHHLREHCEVQAV